MAINAEPGAGRSRERVIGGYQLLQVLVGIRLRSVNDPESRRHLSWLSDVTAAMTLLNRRVSDEGPVDFGAYLEDTAGFWRRAVEARPIRIDVRASDIDVPETHAMPLAIILHELMSNAVRHGFPGDRRGSIAAAYSRATDGVSLVVRDSGVGAEALVNGDGLSLVDGLVRHLGGSWSVETAPEAGVGVRVRLPLSGEPRH